MSPPAKVITILLVILITCAAISRIFFQNGFRISWGDTTRQKIHLYDGGGIQLYQGKKLEQTFVANYPGLSQIEILFSEADGQGINFYLKHNCTQAESLVSQRAALRPVNTPTFYAFNFPPLDDSAGQTYCLILEMPQTTTQSKIKIPLSREDLYPYGALTEYNPPLTTPAALTVPDTTDNPKPRYQVFLPILNKPGEAIAYVEDIGFQLRYKGLIWPTAQVFITRLTVNRPYLWGQAWFYGGLVLFYSVVLVGLFFVVRGTIRAERG